MSVRLSARYAGLGGTAKRPHKFRAVPTDVDGVRFASKKEATRYAELRLLERGGKILGLKLQPRYPLVVSGKLIATYVGDFGYTANGLVVCEDAKGMETPAFKIKIALACVLYPSVQFVVNGVLR